MATHRPSLRMLIAPVCGAALLLAACGSGVQEVDTEGATGSTVEAPAVTVPDATTTSEDAAAGTTTTSASDVTDTTAASGAVPPAEDPGDLGDDAELDALAQDCFDGDFSACDQLFFESPVDSDYEAYGDSCGGRNEPGGLCVTIYGQG